MKSSKVKIRKYRSEDIERIFRLLENEYQRNFKRKEWFWRYEQKRDGGLGVYWIVEIESKIVGGRGAIPLRMQVGNKELTIGETVDTIVAKAFRRTGVYPIMLKKTQEEFRLGHVLEMMGTFSKPRPQAYKGLVKNGFRVIGHLNTWVKPLKISKIIYKIARLKISKNVTVDKKLKNDFHKITKNYEWKINDIICEILLHPNVEELASIWRSRLSNDYVQVKKDADRIKWRYLSSPKKYQFLTIRNVSGVPLGGLIFKRKLVRGLDIYEILDLSATENKNYRILLKSFTEWAKKQNVDLIRLVMYKYLSRRMMISNGFLPISKNVYWLIKDWAIPSDVQHSFVLNADNWRIIAGDIESF